MDVVSAIVFIQQLFGREIAVVVALQVGRVVATIVSLKVECVRDRAIVGVSTRGTGGSRFNATDS